MKYKYSDDKDTVNFIKSALQENDGYCPSRSEMRGNEDFECPCRQFREEAKKGETCLCGLYVKVKK
jgi:ferredoxin-thioredoxin reductase catalytic subunit